MDGWKKIMAKRIAEKAKGIAKKTWDANKSLMMLPVELSAGAVATRAGGDIYRKIQEDPALKKKYKKANFLKRLKNRTSIAKGM